MDLQIQAEEADTSTYVLNGEWALLGMFLEWGENTSMSIYSYTKHILQRDIFEFCFKSQFRNI